MKKNKIILLIASLILATILINIAFHWFYFNNLNRNTRIATLEEEGLIKQVLEKANINTSEIVQFHLYIKGKTEFAQVELIQDTIKTKYIINLKTEKITRR